MTKSAQDKQDREDKEARDREAKKALQTWCDMVTTFST
jgi:hypothetical protein